MPIPLARRGRAVASHVLELGLDLLDPFADQSPVRLELALAGAPRADPAAGAREVRPHAGQTRQVVLERGELDLEAALLRLRVPREDVDDQCRSVQHLAVEQLLEAALLVRLQLVVDDEDVEVDGRLLVHELGCAALAEVPHRIWRRASLKRRADDGGPGRLGQGGELGKRPAHRPASVGRIVEADEEGALVGGGEVDHAGAFGHLFDMVPAQLRAARISRSASSTSDGSSAGRSPARSHTMRLSRRNQLSCRFA